MDNTKKSFVLYMDYKKHVDRLPDEEAGKLLRVTSKKSCQMVMCRFDGREMEVNL